MEAVKEPTTILVHISDGNSKKFHQMENHASEVDDIDKAGNKGKNQPIKSP